MKITDGGQFIKKRNGFETLWVLADNIHLYILLLQLK